MQKLHHIMVFIVISLPRPLFWGIKVYFWFTSVFCFNIFRQLIPKSDHLVLQKLHYIMVFIVISSFRASILCTISAFFVHFSSLWFCTFWCSDVPPMVQIWIITPCNLRALKRIMSPILTSWKWLEMGLILDAVPLTVRNYSTKTWTLSESPWTFWIFRMRRLSNNFSVQKILLHCRG